MSVSSRSVFGREFQVTPVWLWMLQRVSGLLLGPLVALHVFGPDLINKRALYTLLLAVILAHGYSGLRRVAMADGKATLCTMLALVWCMVVAFFGALLVLFAEA